MIRLSKKDFRRWLVKRKRVIVGVAESPCGCAFHGYLKWRGARSIRIQIKNRLVDGKFHRHNQWQRDFQIEAMKLEGELDVIGLRGREALAVLDGLDL